MTLLEQLDRLDRRVLTRGRSLDEQQAFYARRWWWMLLSALFIAVFQLISAVVLLTNTSGPRSWPPLVFLTLQGVILSFQAGYWYGERLRQQGIDRPWWMLEPRPGGSETASAPPEPGPGRRRFPARSPQ